MKELFDRLNIKPKNLELYTTAFSHSSYVNENHIKSDYERLEFLGYVCENACYEYSKDLNLSKYIKVGHGEEIDGGRYKKVILADIFEALMGAIYLDLGFSTAKRVIDSIVIPYVEDPNILFFSDYKSALQEYVQTKQKSLEYEVVLEQGPAHNKLFTTVVKIDGIIYGKGSAGSKKEAEQEAARDALKILAR